MVFPYLPSPQRDQSGKIIEEKFLPVIPIRIIYKHKLGRLINALTDSGSDRNLFPAAYGELVGIPVKKGKLIDITGIGNISIKAYRWEIKLYVGSTAFITLVDFSYEQQIPLLGRNGFFNKFSEVIFRDKTKEIILNK